MADKVPLYVGRELTCFLNELIDVVFSKVSLSRLIGSLEVLHRLRLAHCQKGAPLSQHANFLRQLS